MARPSDQEPTVETTNGAGSKETRYQHPAFGQIRASRVQGQTTLYGSDFVHQHFVTVSINHSELHRTLSRDWPFARGEIIEVMLSEAQWATFVSSMNVGMGVQCTINHLNGKMVPGIAHHASDHEFKNEVRDAINSAVSEVDATAELVKSLGLPKGKERQILDRLRHARQQIDNHVPFVADQFDEYVEHTIEKAKVEANAYLTGLVTRAGLEALQAPAITDQREPEDK